MQLLKIEQACLAYGNQVILDNTSLLISSGDRICLVGRNGTGKSTLFKIITGETQADEGNIWRSDTLRVSSLAQEVPEDSEHTVYEMVSAGLGKVSQVLSDYHNLLLEIEKNNGSDQKQLDQLARLQQEIELNDGWNLSQKIDSVIDKLQLPPEQLLSGCSGGMRRRVMLAQALVSEPDLLLLDEPTNHMDIEAITWLEEFLKNYSGALLFITHDRTFVRNLSNRIVELDRGVLTSFSGDYNYYLEKKQEILEIEEKANALFDKKLAEHEVWIRKGIKARRTRNEGRVRKLKGMREEQNQRLNVQGRVNFSIEDSDLSGKIVSDVRHVNFSYRDHPIMKDFSCRIIRGDRIGIIGPNGSGKSTLLKIILGQLIPDDGEVVNGTKIELAYFDQHREQLEMDKTVRDNISDGMDYVNVRGHQRHVISYLKDFLFPPDRINSKVRILSGGERNRLLLARIFTRKANLLIMDEPTNDLDVDTLELLEDLLSDYDGTLLLVSHDRTFLDNVVSSTLVFENGTINQYVGGYNDWLRQSNTRTEITAKKQTSQAQKKTSNNAEQTNTKSQKAKTKLSYKHQRELDKLPNTIESLEYEITTMEQTIGHSDFYQQPKDKISSALSQLELLRQNLQSAYDRWEELDNH